MTVALVLIHFQMYAACWQEWWPPWGGTGYLYCAVVGRRFSFSWLSTVGHITRRCVLMLVGIWYYVYLLHRCYILRNSFGKLKCFCEAIRILTQNIFRVHHFHQCLPCTGLAVSSTVFPIAQMYLLTRCLTSYHQSSSRTSFHLHCRLAYVFLFPCFSGLIFTCRALSISLS